MRKIYIYIYIKFVTANHEQRSDVTHFAYKRIPNWITFSPTPVLIVKLWHSGPHFRISILQIWTQNQLLQNRLGEKQIYGVQATSFVSLSLITSFTIPLFSPNINPSSLFFPSIHHPLLNPIFPCLLFTSTFPIFFSSLPFVLLFAIDSFCSLCSWLSRQAYDSHSKNLFIEIQTELGHSNILIFFQHLPSECQHPCKDSHLLHPCQSIIKHTSKYP
jgi:hypothetical protein